MNIINVKNLSVSFDGRQVFKNLNFSIKKGDYFCILGENGSGKTTLMQCILHSGVKYSGTIEYNGFSRRDIGWLSQKTETKSDFPASVYEVVMSGFSGSGSWGFCYGKKQRQKALENMKLLDISELKNRSFKELSGGQQQKVLLCRALCAAGGILLLDEPVTGLDTISQNELYEIISSLNKKGMSVIMISHDVKRAVKEASAILHIGDGDFFFGSTRQYIKTEYYRRLEVLE